MAIALKVAGTSYTLTQAQLRSLVHTTQANDPARLTGQIYRAAIPTADWAAGDTVELWVGGVRRFAGWLGPVEIGLDARGSYVAIQAEDILGRLRGTTFTRYGAEIAGYNAEGVPIYSAGATRQSAVTLFSGQMAATDPVSDYYQYTYNSSSSAQIAEVVGLAALAYPGALALGTITGLSTANIPEKVTDLDCLSVLQRCLSLRPDAVLWVDPSGATPLLHAAVRSALTPVSVSVAPGNTTVRSWSCRDRSDRLLQYMEWRLQYTYKEYNDPAAPEKGVTSQPVVLVYNYGDAGAPSDKRHIRRFQLGAYAPVYASGTAAAAQLGTPISQLPLTAAADYWAANSVLHYEGGLTLYEPTGCTYAWSLGQTLSLSGAATAYETAAALVRGATYDLVSGQTDIDFGPPDQLSAGDLINGASSLGSLTLGGITPTVADAQAENPAQSNGGKGESSGEQADTLTQRIQDKLGSFALQAGSGFQMATMDVTATIHGFAEYVASSPPKAYKRATASGSWNGEGLAYKEGYDAAGVASGSITVSISGVGMATASGAMQLTSSQVNNPYGGYSVATFTDHAPAPVMTWPSYDFYNPPFSKSYSSLRCVNSSDQTSVIWIDSEHYFGYLFSGGPLVVTLDQEDTDADARARAQAAASWSAWTAFVSALNGAAAYQTVRTKGWSSTAHLAKIKATTLRSNIWGYPGRVSIPIYRYAIGGAQPSTPTSTQTFDIYFADTLENIAAEGEAAVWQHVGVASMPEWELPCEQGFVNLAGSPTVSLL